MKKLFVFACLLMACSGSGDPAPYIVPVSAAGCDAACAAMNTKLTPPDAGPDVVGCEEGLPITLKDGGTMSCVDFCKYQHDNGVDWRNECISNEITTCEEIETVCNSTN